VDRGGLDHLALALRRAAVKLAGEQPRAYRGGPLVAYPFAACAPEIAAWNHFDVEVQQDFYLGQLIPSIVAAGDQASALPDLTPQEGAAVRELRENLNPAQWQELPDFVAARLRTSAEDRAELARRNRARIDEEARRLIEQERLRELREHEKAEREVNAARPTDEAATPRRMDITVQRGHRGERRAVFVVDRERQGVIKGHSGGPVLELDRGSEEPRLFGVVRGARSPVA